MRIVTIGCLLVGASSAMAQVQTVTYYYTDPQGTVLATTDEAGNITSSIDRSPYGAVVIGSASNGLGYTGHVTDETSLIYMQARYYDPQVGRFYSVDPVVPEPGDVFSVNRYLYVDGNPVTKVDPSGRTGILFWSASNQVTYTLPYVVGLAPGAHMPLSSAQINAAISKAFSGTVNINGQQVTISARAVEGAAGKAGTTNFLKVVPDTAGVTKSGRSETNQIGGNVVTVASGGKYAVTPEVVAHELGGHSGGAGDQYLSGVAADGSVITSEAPGASGIMKVLDGSGANEQSLREIIQATSNVNTCAPDVNAASGRC